jgi:hypothetical protein
MSCEERVRATGKIDEAQGRAVREKGNGGNMVLAIWALTLFTAFLFGLTIVNVIITRQSYDVARSQTEAIKGLNESMMEVRKSLAEFSGVLQDAHETEHGFEDNNPFQRSFLGDEKV